MKEDLWLPLRFAETKFNSIPIIVDDFNLVPFQFRTLNASTGTVTAFLVDTEDAETSLAITIHIYTIGTYTYYTFSDTVVPLSSGTYYLKLVDGSYIYYSVPFKVCPLEPMAATGNKKWDMWLPLKFMSAPFNYIPILVDCIHLIPFQFRTKNASTGTVTASLVSKAGVESSLTMDIKIYQIGNWTYYLFDDIIETIDPGVYYLKLTDGAFVYFSVPFEVCCYKTNIKYGFLYNFPAVEKEITSTGWHIMTLAESIGLAAHLDPAFDPMNPIADVSGKEMKESGTTYWDAPNTGTNSSRFNGRGGGMREVDGTFLYLKQSAQFWTDESSGVDNAYVASLEHDEDWFMVNFSTFDKNTGCSLRAVKDATSLSEGECGTYIGNNGQKYNTRVIGGKEYTIENLIETKWRDGTDIPNVISDALWAVDTTGARCSYDNDNFFV